MCLGLILLITKSPNEVLKDDSIGDKNQTYAEKLVKINIFQ